LTPSTPLRPQHPSHEDGCSNAQVISWHVATPVGRPPLATNSWTQPSTLCCDAKLHTGFEFQ